VRCSLVEAVWPDLVAAYRCAQGVAGQRRKQTHIACCVAETPSCMYELMCNGS
jgi:hypothetical protein